jgi:hypothetical protein
LRCGRRRPRRSVHSNRMGCGTFTYERITSEPGRPRLARSRHGDRGPRQEVEETKLSGNRRGFGRLHSTYETSNKAHHKSAAETVEGRRPVGGKASGNACSGLSAGFSMSPKPQAYGSVIGGVQTHDHVHLRQEPGAGKPHAAICGGGAGRPTPLPDKVHYGEGAAIHADPGWAFRPYEATGPDGRGVTAAARRSP